MLVVTRKPNESLIIADKIEVTVLEITKGSVKIGVEAPKDVKVIRNELWNTQNVNRDSSDVLAKGAFEALLKINRED